MTDGERGRDGAAGAATFQERNAAWMDHVAEGDPTDLAERIHRFWEEAAELGQSLGGSREEWEAIGRHVFSRPPGRPAQEMGGSRTTLSLLAATAGLDEDACGEAELARCWTPEVVAKVRHKRAGRHGRGPLPGPDPEPALSGEDGPRGAAPGGPTRARDRARAEDVGRAPSGAAPRGPDEGGRAPAPGRPATGPGKEES